MVEELSKYGFVFCWKKDAIKGQVHVDFVTELTQPLAAEVVSFPWVLLIDEAINKAGRGARLVLEGLDGVVMEQSLKFNFSLTHNQAKYEALLASMCLAQEMEVT